MGINISYILDEITPNSPNMTMKQNKVMLKNKSCWVLISITGVTFELESQYSLIQSLTSPL